MRREILPQIEGQKTQEYFVYFKFFAQKAGQRRAGVLELPNSYGVPFGDDYNTSRSDTAMIHSSVFSLQF